MLDARFALVNLNGMVRREWILIFRNFFLQIFNGI